MNARRLIGNESRLIFPGDPNAFVLGSRTHRNTLGLFLTACQANGHTARCRAPPSRGGAQADKAYSNAARVRTSAEEQARVESHLRQTVTNYNRRCTLLPKVEVAEASRA